MKNDLPVSYDSIREKAQKLAGNRENVDVLPVAFDVFAVGNETT